MEFRQAFDEWSRAHHAAHEAEVKLLQAGPGMASAEDQAHAAQLRQAASRKLRVMLAVSAAVAAACRPP